MSINLMRQLVFRIRHNERLLRLRARTSPNGFTARVVRSGVLRFQSSAVANGAAIGMFWAFIPMPLQMIPATFSCMLARANLPVAIACVWISNPLTYVPIFYGQYQVGLWLFGSEVQIMGWEDFSTYFSAGIMEALSEYLTPILKTLLQGALVTSVFSAIVGYAAGLIFFYYINASKKNVLATTGNNPQSKNVEEKTDA